MKHIFVFLLVAGFMFASAHRVPAPISVTETPMPTATPKPRSKPAAKTERAEKPQPKTKSKQSPFAPFVGTWSGTVKSTATASLLFSTSSSMMLPITIRVSKNGVVNRDAEPPVQGTVSPDGRVLSWNIQKNISEMVSRTQSSMRLIGPNSASYSDTNVIDGAIAAVSGSSTGTLYKR